MKIRVENATLITVDTAVKFSGIVEFTLNEEGKKEGELGELTTSITMLAPKTNLNDLNFSPSLQRELPNYPKRACLGKFNYVLVFDTWSLFLYTEKTVLKEDCNGMFKVRIQTSMFTNLLHIQHAPFEESCITACVSLIDIDNDNIRCQMSLHAVKNSIDTFLATTGRNAESKVLSMKDTMSKWNILFGCLWYAVVSGTYSEECPKDVQEIDPNNMRKVDE
jgi:hypothetical protein